MESEQNQELSTSESSINEVAESNKEAAQSANNEQIQEREVKVKTFKDSIRDKLVEKPEQKQESKSKQEQKKISFEEIGSVSPADMSKEEREIFEKLDPKAQSYLARISKQYRADYGRQTQQIKNMEGRIKPIWELVSSQEQELAKFGVRPEDAVKEGLAWKKAFLTDKKAAAKEIFKTYGIDPIDLIDDDLPEDSQSQGLDPNQLKEQIRQEIMQEFEQKKAEQEKTIALQNSQSVVNKFMKSKPLFSDPAIGERLEAEMAAVTSGILQSQPNQDVEAVLEKAYNYVVNGNSEFSELLKKYNAKFEAEKLQSEADKARIASRTVSGGVSTPVPNLNRGVPFKEAFRRNLGTS